MNSKYFNALCSGEYYITKEDAKRQCDAIFPIRVINEHNKIVNFCLTKKEAKLQIAKRNKALILLGHCPKNYQTISKNTQNEFNNREFYAISNR